MPDPHWASQAHHKGCFYLLDNSGLDGRKESLSDGEDLGFNYFLKRFLGEGELRQGLMM